MGMGHVGTRVNGIWDQPDNAHIYTNGYGISILRNIKNVELGEIFLEVLLGRAIFQDSAASPFPALFPDTIPIVS